MNYVHAASQATCAAQGFLQTILSAVFWPLIILLTAAALLYFLWGAFKFIANAHNATERESGRRHMIYGVIGLLVMVSALAIFNIAARTFGLSISDPGCSAWNQVFNNENMQFDSVNNPGEIGEDGVMPPSFPDSE